MRIGYACVWAEDASTDAQVEALRAHGCETIYQEHRGGKNSDPSELDHCLTALGAGDTLTVWRLDCLGRNLADLIRIVNALHVRGAGFASLTECIDSTAPAGALVFQVFSALAGFERNRVRERTVAGLKTARARGKPSGRPPKLTGKELALAKTLMADKSNKVDDIAKRFGVNRSTLYRVTK